MGTGIGRTELERDYDRILFSTPLRRLADKTQVFPLEENNSIRNRLTHSHEVSNLARSIGVKLAFDFPEKVFGNKHECLNVKRNVPSLLAAVGLAHDLGNPPFGHQGEVAIQEWFKEYQKRKRRKLRRQDDIRAEELNMKADFLKFDGNAQTLRLLTRLQVLNDDYGLNLTLATLASLIKYPVIYGGTNKLGFKKCGIFESERDIVSDVWKYTGLKEGVRHPFVYIMEACDDIAYSIIDAEDTVKKGYASFYDLMDYLESNSHDDPIVKEVITKSRSKNKEFKNENLSSKELNDISMQMFRVKAISMMIESATNTFVNNVNHLLSGEVESGFELIKESECNRLCTLSKKFDLEYGFKNREVLELELKGNNYIKNTMSMFWKAISSQNGSETPFSRYAYGEISENYRRVYEKSYKGDYEKFQLLSDVVSGMTDNHLIKVHNDLKGLENSYE